VCVPYVKGLNEAFARILKSHSIATANRPHRTLRNFVVHPKDKVKDEEKTDLMYRVPYKKWGLNWRLHWGDRQEVWSEDQGAQERSGLFHGWYTDPSLQGKGEQCNSQVSHHRPCRGREPCHRLGQCKSGRQGGTATDQMDKRGILDQEDTDMHESGRRILPTQPHMGPGNFQVTCSKKL